MANATAIAWTTFTWNWLRGCTHASDGCRNCWAERNAARFWKTLYRRLITFVEGKGWKWTGEVDFVARHLYDPLRMKQPAKLFVNSVSDTFHPKVQREWIARGYAVMWLASRHVFQVLTKRTERARELLSDPTFVAEVEAWGRVIARERKLPDPGPMPWPLPNVWHGCSVENQFWAQIRCKDILRTPAAVRWVSFEPALARVDFLSFLSTYWTAINAPCRWPGCGPVAKTATTETWHGHRLDWIVIGVESLQGGRAGRGADEYEAVARSVIEQCADVGVAVFHKQMPVNGKVSHDPREWPADLRKQDFPAVAA